MNRKKELSFPLLVISIVLGAAIYNQFNIYSLKFEKPALSVVYILTFAMTVFLLFKRKKY